MSKAQKQRKRSKSSSKRKPKRNNFRVPAGLVDKARDLAHMLADPCGAPISTGLYPGEIGMAERFVSENFIVGSGNTAGYLAFHPNTGWFQFSNIATSSGASASTFQTTDAPGQAFLTANAQKVRGLGACIQAVCSSLSITSITGEIAMGVMSADTLKNNGTISADRLFTVLQARSALTREIKEIKWFPATQDNKFATYISGSTSSTWDTTGSDFSDTNVIVVCARNLPSGTSLNLRVTWICEWTPKPNLGLVPNPNAAPGINHLSVVSSMEKAHPSWWTNLSSTANNLLGAFANQAMQAAGVVAQRGLSRVAQTLPLLL